MSLRADKKMSIWQQMTQKRIINKIAEPRSEFRRLRLSIYSQRDLDRIAHSLNTRPRAVLGFHTPEEVFMIELSKLGDALQI